MCALYYPTSKSLVMNEFHYVNEVQTNREWNKEKSTQLLPKDIVEHITKTIQLPNPKKEIDSA